MKSVPFDDLVYEDDCTYTHEGVPFTGVAYDLFSDGSRRSEAEFISGHQEGLAKEWYANGQLRFERTYMGDGLHGVSQEWYPSGHIKEASTCEFGIVIESKQWNEAGEVSKEFRLQPSNPTFDVLMKKRLIHGERG